MRQADAHREARQGPGAQRPRRHLHLVLRLRILREAVVDFPQKFLWLVREFFRRLAFITNRNRNRAGLAGGAPMGASRSARTFGTRQSLRLPLSPESLSPVPARLRVSCESHGPENWRVPDVALGFGGQRWRSDRIWDPCRVGRQ